MAEGKELRTVSSDVKKEYILMLWYLS